MGFNVKVCCRLCQKDAANDTATHIDLRQRQEVGELIVDLFGVDIKRSERGSNFICVTCYKDVTNLKKHIDVHRAKSKLVSLNQAILNSQLEAFPEEDEHELEDNETRFETTDGYRPPASTPVDMLLLVEDCMRSKRFRDALQDPFEVKSLMLVSGPIYQEDTDSFLNMWHPIQFFCTKCCLMFDDSATIDAHHGKCRYKCLYCKRTYTFLESHTNHVCPKRDRLTKAKKRKYVDVTMEPPAKRAKVTEEPNVSNNEPLHSTTPSKSPEKNGIQVLTLPDLLPAPVVVPHIEGEANLDAELSNLLERWYGQNEDIEELNHTNLGAIQISNENGVITNSEFYGRVIDTTYRNTTTIQRPAISVKPISQLIDSSTEKTTASTQSSSDPSMEVIEIDDDDDVAVGQAIVPTVSAPLLNRPDQPALSESDILNIVKHFRGIDENESYLIKAKINGAQKLICISKRKGEGSGTQTPNTATVVNNNSALQSISRRPEQRPMVVAPRPQSKAVNSTVPQISSTAAKPSLSVKNVSDINGVQNSIQAPRAASIPQLKIAHVQSLVEQPQASQGTQQVHRLPNGKQVMTVTQPINRQTPTGGNPKIVTIPKRTPMPVRSGSNNQQSTSGGDSRRIVVGSNSLKLLNTSKPSTPNATKSIVTSNNLSNSTTSQQRFIVQRKQVQTIIQSSVSRTSTGAVSSIQSVTDSNNGPANSLLRSQLLQRPPRIYPGSAGPAPHSDGVSVAQPKIVATGGKVMSVSPSGRQFQLNSTTITRLN
ncbi:uncharacterized protein LOC131435267 [Malaya genurostris]|uniref:uncharacterized protein LOC131435267 n=1 Tax=Malaya genurostris TaxID=325434 RepID=UPI0026F3E394|nr:uncharacterized protein LOC131435267 [Malaya genurostris]